MRRLRLCLLAGLVAAGAAYAAGCGSSNVTNVVGPPPPPPDSDSVVAVDIDLRFKGVGILSGNPLGFGSFVDSRLGFGAIESSGSPLALGDSCTPDTPFTGCTWFLTTYPLSPKDSGLAVFYEGFDWSDFATSFQDSLLTDTVVTSLDLEPADSEFASSVYIESVDAGYKLTKKRVTLGGLSAAAVSEASQHRVITAVSFVNDSVEYFAYSWQHDTNTAGYDTRVRTAAATGDVPGAAQSLADAGYTITGFGGDSTDGFILVGTRIHGSTTPRTLTVVPNSRAGIVGSATVAFLADENGFTVIGEK